MKDPEVELYWALVKSLEKWKEYAELNKIDRQLSDDNDLEARLFQECEKIRKNYKKIHKDQIKKHLKSYLK